MPDKVPQYPYDTVVYVTDTINGINYQASGVLIAPDEVLTASHVVYTASPSGGRGSYATNIAATPGYSAGSYTGDATSTGLSFHCNQVNDANDQITPEQSQYDFAVIHLNRFYEDLGYMGIQADQPGPVTAYVAGYPSIYGGQLASGSETFQQYGNLSVYQSGATGPGSSGGPVWINKSDGPYVIGLVSSGDGTNGYFCQITGSDLATIEGWVRSDNAIGSDLVDPLFYNRQNLDVAAAGVNASTHYAQFGLHEGRDPDAYFSTIGYLAANPDVAAARSNPTSHYDSFGWREGRDPSAGFNTRLYLLDNPDVARAGIDPLWHYLNHGQYENRPALEPAIGRAWEINGAFDPEYYLLANPDVARAGFNAGNVYQHYETHGWHEGRDPNPFFDVRYYLAANPDVAAAMIDPLFHYDQYGWHEGRNPSAGFNTDAYLQHAPDVAAAHVDPLQHYLQFGIYEGRVTH